MRGELEGAAPLADRQVESPPQGVDPAAYDLYLRGRQAWNQQSLARDFVGRSLLALGRPREAIQVSQGSATPTPEMLATMSLAHLRLGDRARAEALFSELAAQKAAADRRHRPLVHRDRRLRQGP